MLHILDQHLFPQMGQCQCWGRNVGFSRFSVLGNLVSLTQEAGDTKDGTHPNRVMGKQEHTRIWPTDSMSKNSNQQEEYPCHVNVARNLPTRKIFVKVWLIFRDVGSVMSMFAVYMWISGNTSNHQQRTIRSKLSSAETSHGYKAF